jgi:excinuclease UvrABC helicase subunit UvrB
MLQTAVADARGTAEDGVPESLPEAAEDGADREQMLARLEVEMLHAAESLEFELAATLRDRILDMRADASAPRPRRAAPPRRPQRARAGRRRR